MKSNEKHLIKCTDIDLDKIVQLRLEALRINPDSFGEKFKDANKRTIEDWKTWFLQRSSGLNKIFIVQNEFKYVGMCGLFFDNTKPTKPYLWGIYIKPDERKSGLGRLLVAKVIESVKESPASSLTLRVEKENQKALSFYQSLGFKEVNSPSQQTEMNIKLG